MYAFRVVLSCLDCSSVELVSIHVCNYVCRGMLTVCVCGCVRVHLTSSFRNVVIIYVCTRMLCHSFIHAYEVNTYCAISIFLALFLLCVITSL